MQPSNVQTFVLTVLLLMPAAVFAKQTEGPARQAVDDQVTQGALRIERADGSIVECPLKHTEVESAISGFIARVKVTQTFYNPLDEKIEAVYVFPLPHKAAVDGMTMVLESRRVVGIVKRRDAARQIYEQALAHGRTAALLEQERPNIFTQSVGNIEPRQAVEIEISYVDVLDYDMGVYKFHFPMVVGPRFIPGSPAAPPPDLPSELSGATSGAVPPTDRVPDANRISPPVLKPGMRNGHDIALSVRLDAAVPIQDLKVVNHRAAVEQTGKSTASVELSPADNIPNKDFELRYKVVGQKPELATLANTGAGGQGYFMLMIQPREDRELAKAPPRELYFVIDVSGSMRGKPTAQVKEVMKHCFKLCKPEDTLQVVTFAGQAKQLFEKAVPVTEENVDRALNFTRNIRAGGGTHMLEGIKKVMSAPADPRRVRIALLLTDGYIGNEAEIIAEVGRRCGDQLRMWCLGVGNSVNRFLIDGVARQGGGMGKVLSLNEDPAETVREIMDRIHRAQLAHIEIDWGRAPVYDVLPARIPELWAGRPVIVFGRYEAGVKTTVTVSGKAEGTPVEWTLEVDFPVAEPANAVLAKVWARHKIEDLMHQTYYSGSPAVEEAVTGLALEYGLMSRYTSFVAVDEKDLDEARLERARAPRRMLVPVPLPEGKSWSGIFGSPRADASYERPEPDVHRVRRKQVAIFQGAAGLNDGYVPPAAASAPLGPVPSLRERRSPAITRLGGGHWQSPATPRPSGGMRGYLGSAPGSGGAVFKEREVLRRAEDVEEMIDGQTGYAVHHGFAKNAGKLRKLTERLMNEAEAARKDGASDRARALFVYACMLDTAHQALTHAPGGSADACLEAIERIDRARLKTWTDTVPGLDTRIELVLCNLDPAEALRAVAEAAGLKIALAAGSVEDAAAALHRKRARVAYLDLSNVQTAEALDWLLYPLRLEWRLTGADKEASLIAGSARRLPGAAAWVYDIAPAAIPLADEIPKSANWQQKVEAAHKIAGTLLEALTKALDVEPDHIAWFAPGELILFAEPETHARAEKLLAQLSDPDAAVPEDLAQVHKLTARRAAGRAAAAAKAAEARERLAVAGDMKHYAPVLLAAAADGRVDFEALCRLREAWQAPEAEVLLEETSAAALRSAWAVLETARTLPADKQLGELSALVRKQARPAAEAALAAARKAPEGDATLLSALYAALALRDDRAVMAEAATALLDTESKNDQARNVRLLARLLLRDPAEDQAAALVKSIESGPRGEDSVLLSALAARRAGGEAWSTFRRARNDVLGRQPLPGALPVLVSRLERTDLACLK